MNPLFEGHTRTGKDEWLTPPVVLHALTIAGPFDLDPCAPIKRPWATAKKHYTIEDDGLAQPWEGLVFCNPPYGDSLGQWLKRCADHGNAIALAFMRSETQAFHCWVWGKCHAMFVFEGRLCFYNVSGQPSGPAGSPSVLIAYGEIAAHRLFAAADHLSGYFIGFKK